MFQSLNKTIREISKYPVKDSHTWTNIFQEYLQERESIFKSPNNPSYVSKYTEDRNSDELNYFRQFRIEIQSMRSWSNELFESEEFKLMFGTFLTFVGLSPDEVGSGTLCYLFSCAIHGKGNNVVRGGFGNLPLALEKYLRSGGGRTKTKSKVTKIETNGNRATGVRLDNGQMIVVRKVIASSTDPSTLILDLIGEQYVGLI
ncbi:MAG TPA: FAD-dependent oxidoreductase [Candidatus Nitrosocosmicus sp.]|nr:FAD-dependent oxidoreductase [Candidatus Nitrosocosmicus sp.]